MSDGKSEWYQNMTPPPPNPKTPAIGPPGVVNLPYMPPPEIAEGHGEVVDPLLARVEKLEKEVEELAKAVDKLRLQH